MGELDTPKEVGRPCDVGLEGMFSCFIDHLCAFEDVGVDAWEGGTRK